MRCLASILSLFHNEFNKFNKYKSTNVRFYLSYDIKITLKSHFCRKIVIILSLCTQCCYGRHGVISLPDATSYDKLYFRCPSFLYF